MEAYKCDRCGTLYQRATVPDITIHQYYHGYGTQRKDICPKCQKILEEWLKSDPLTINEEIKKEFNKIITLFEFAVDINAESVTIQSDEIPRILQVIKEQNLWRKDNPYLLT